MSCAFTNERRGDVNARVFDDANGDRARQPTEDWLADWTVAIYDLDGTEPLSTATDPDGRVALTRVAPGEYLLCATVPDGWTATQPPSVHPRIGLPCREIAVEPGAGVYRRFGFQSIPTP